MMRRSIGLVFRMCASRTLASSQMPIAARKVYEELKLNGQLE